MVSDIQRSPSKELHPSGRGVVLWRVHMVGMDSQTEHIRMMPSFDQGQHRCLDEMIGSLV